MYQNLLKFQRLKLFLKSHIQPQFPQIRQAHKLQRLQRPPQTPTVVTPPPQTTTPKANTYSLADVAKHAKASDCWMVVDTGVFDVTAYVTRHPGGARIVQGCGKDATDMFFNISKHGGRAEDILAGYYIGDLS